MFRARFAVRAVVVAAAASSTRAQEVGNYTHADTSSSSSAVAGRSISADNDVSYYVYIFLGVLAGLAAVSILVYCIHQRRVHRFTQRDNNNNNMQRHSLIDSYVEAGEVEWQCSICYHENHPAKRECIMCGTPEVISQQALASPAAVEKRQASLASGAPPEVDSKTLQLAARNRSFHVRRLNEMNLNQRQRGARRRHLWQREKAHDGQFRWVRMEDCRPSRISILSADLPPQLLSQRDSQGSELDDAYIFGDLDQHARSRHEMIYNGDENLHGGVETELTMHVVDDESGETYAPTIRRNMPDRSQALAAEMDRAVVDAIVGVEEDDNSGFIAQPSVGYVRHVDEHGNVEWVPAESVIHEDVEVIDVGEYPRASSAIDFESVAALTFRQKVRWFLMEIDKVSVPWEEGHLLLKIRREAILNESMHLLMLVPASDLRQRLRIEFIDEPGLDAGGLLREWVLLLCEKLFDESFGLFQPTHVENLGYWINPNSAQIHRDHLKCYQFVGRLVAKCLLEGQLLTVHFSLPLLKHILGVPISFSDLEFLDEELYRNATWLRDNENVDNLSLDFTIQHMDGNDEMVTTELKPGGRDVLVTDENKEEYLDLLMKYKMFDSVKEQLSALLQGLYDVIPRTLLAVFDYQELELLLCGVPNIDVDDWQAHTDVKYQDLDKPSKLERKVVDWFWETVRRFSQEERARLLQFVTGTSRVPVEGFKALVSNDGRVRRFGIHLVQCGVPPTGLYPKSHTCFNRIDLPVYHCKDQLETYLTLVINMEITGFSMQ